MEDLPTSFSLAYIQLCPCTSCIRQESYPLKIVHSDNQGGNCIQKIFQRFQHALPHIPSPLPQFLLAHQTKPLSPPQWVFRSSSMDMHHMTLRRLVADLKL